MKRICLTFSASSLAVGMCLLILSAQFVYGQGYVAGDIIFKTKTSSTLEEMEVLLDGNDFDVTEELVASLDIFLLKIVNLNLTEADALVLLKQLSFIEWAQLNHILYSRLSPNDTDFGSQWSLSQQSDIDIDAPEAWSISPLGGYGPDGEDVVVGIVDGGCLTSHSDLVANRWTNESELNGLPGVDDDGNGATDDVYGWNAYNQTPTPNVAEHGTNVTGIAAGVGNNNQGICGIGWHTKFVFVSGSDPDNEAVTSRAFNYFINTKQRWYDTDGEMGANIVAVNISFGIDGGDCADFPFWESALNGLGGVGITPVAATANQNWNVDVVGDVPTGCASQYLLAVTNTDQADIRYRGGAAWGSNSVDLGAPGTGIWSTRSIGGVGDIGTGTSFSSPHVAGAVALISSIPNPAFSEFASAPPNRDEALELIRNIVMFNGDVNSDLSGITVSGRRLNIANSVEAMCNYYIDNGHDLLASSVNATGPSSSPNYARSGNYQFVVFEDGDDVIYAWRSNVLDWKYYKLTSDLYPRSKPSICAGTQDGKTQIHIAWLGGPDKLMVLEHVVNGSNPPQQEWRLARLAQPAPSGAGVVLTSPIVIRQNGKLALYTDILERKGMSVGRHGFIWDSHGREVRYDFNNRMWEKYLAALEEVRTALAGKQTTMPGASGNCKQCVWYSYCDGELLKNDDLTLVRELGVTKRNEMYPHIKTVAELASANIDQFKSGKRTVFRGLGWDTLVKLQERAKRFNAKTPPSLTEPIKLPVNRRELFFDIEDDTFSGVCYLHGFVERMNHDNSTERYVSFIANTPNAKDEEQAFREAWEFLANATDAVVYYYSHHERTTYIKLSAKYPTVCSEADVKKLFDSDRTIDLLKIVGRSEWPTRDTSIKTLAKFAGFRWRDPHPSGAASMEWFRQWVDGGSVDAKNRILDYNEDDCRATRVVLDEIRKMSSRL